MSSRRRFRLPEVRIPGEDHPVTLLVEEGRILALGDAGGKGVEEPADARGLWCVPGIVDIHCHLTGGGGSEGPATRPAPLGAAELLDAGITEVMGCIGRDAAPGIGWQMLRTIRALRQQGLAAGMFTGGLGPVPAQLLDSPGHDAAVVDGVVGVKFAVDEDAPPRDLVLWRHEVRRIIAMAREFGRGPRIQVHVGPNPRHIELARSIFEPFELGVEVDVALTHVNWSARHVKQAASFLAQGGHADVTSMISSELVEGAVPVPVALAELTAARGGPKRISVSSDANGSHMQETPSGKRVMVAHRLEIHQRAYQRTWQELGPAAAVEAFSIEPARFLGKPAHGRIAPGADADLLLVDESGAPRWTLTAAGTVHRVRESP